MPNRWHGWSIALGICLVLASYVGVPAQESVAPRPAPLTSSPGSDGLRRASDLALLGLIIREGQEAIAVIEDRQTKRQRLYRIGTLVGGGRLTQVLPDRVTLAFNDGEVELRLAGAPVGVASAPPGPEAVVAPPGPSPRPLVPEQGAEAVSSELPRVDRTHLDELIRTPDLVMNVTPVKDRGVRVDDVRKSRLFEILGLRKGDIIRNVNGNVPGAAVPLPQVIAQTAEWGILRFELERDGRTDVRYIQVRP